MQEVKKTTSEKKKTETVAKAQTKPAAVKVPDKAVDVKPAETKPVEKKSAAKKPAAKKTAAKKPAAAKAAPVKEAEKKPAAKKPAAKKTTAKKPAAKKTAKRDVASTISLSKKVNFVLQCSAKPDGVSYNQLISNAKNVWRYDLGGKIGDIKDIQLYVKPEEGKVYYVINGDTTGSFDI